MSQKTIQREQPLVSAVSLSPPVPDPTAGRGLLGTHQMQGALESANTNKHFIRKAITNSWQEFFLSVWQERRAKLNHLGPSSY